MITSTNRFFRIPACKTVNRTSNPYCKTRLRIRISLFPAIQFLKVFAKHNRKDNLVSYFSSAQNFSQSETASDLGTNESQALRQEENKFDWTAQWYPVTAAEYLDKRVPHAITILGYDLVIWWDVNGKEWQVFEDKCPHRLAPLSEGRIAEDGYLQCSYHGWKFSPKTGACSFIPQASPDQIQALKSPRACAVAFPCKEQQGILWFSPNAQENIGSNPPRFPVLDDPAFKYDWNMSNLPYGYETLIENLMDPAHVPFAHHKLQGDRNKAKPLNLRVELVQKSGFTGNSDNGPVEFIPPCTFVNDVNILTSDKVKSSRTESVAKKITMIFICIPIAPGKSKVIWSFPRNFAVWFLQLYPKWLSHLSQMLFLDSDLYFLHVAEKSFEAEKKSKTSCYLATPADAFVEAYRRWLNRFAGGSPLWGKVYDSALPPSPAKPQLMDRYENHVKHCQICINALNNFRLLELVLEVMSIAIIGILAISATKANSIVRPFAVQLLVISLLCFLASRWLCAFVKKNYYFHDYNHALVK